MRSFFTLIAAGLAALPSVSATYVGKAIVKNDCPFQVTVWSVGGSIAGPFTLGPNGGTYSETFVKDPKSGGKALKVTRKPDGLYSGAPQTIFAYNLDYDKVWYDLSDVFGDAFKGHKLAEFSKDRSCPAIVFQDGVPPGGSQVKVCTAAEDVTLLLCAY